jgi:hypothetical protein
MWSQSNSLRDEEDEMFLVEGFLSELHVESGTENLLTRIDKHYRGKAVLTAAGAAVGDLFGQAATAASLVMYDGEDTQNFACLIGDEVMCGQFGGAEWLKVGSRIKAVVSRRKAVLYAHALMDEKQGLLWVGHAWGSKAEARANWKIAWWAYLFQLVGMTLLGASILGLSDKFYLLVRVSFFGMAALCFGIAFWTTRTMRGLSDPSTEVFRLLGFANPESVNLNNHQIALVTSRDFRKEIKANEQAEPALGYDMAEHRRRNVFCYQRAIQDGKVAMVEASPASADS